MSLYDEAGCCLSCRPIFSVKFNHISEHGLHMSDLIAPLRPLANCLCFLFAAIKCVRGHETSRNPPFLWL